MSALRVLDALESPIASKLYNYSPENQWKEQYWQKVEHLIKMKRERILVIFGVLSVLNFAFWDSIPILAHFFCIMHPLLETIKVMQNVDKRSDLQVNNQLLCWVFLAIVSAFDYTRLSSLPFYYFGKMGLCGFIWHKGIDQFAEYFDPILQLTKGIYNAATGLPETGRRPDFDEQFQILQNESEI